MTKSFQLPDFLKNLPNQLTLARIAAIPVLVLLYPLQVQFLNFFCAILFAAAALTDFFDGYVARKYGTQSRLGAIIDPIADKLLVTATIVLLASAGKMAAFIAALLLCREVAVNGFRLIAQEYQFSIEVSNMGKWKTAIQDLALFCLLLDTIDTHRIGLIGILVALGLSYYSAYEYGKELFEKIKER